jgi:hypothetical protein
VRIFFDILAYAASVWILGTYLLFHHGKPVRWFNFANFLGAVPVAIVEILAGTYPPLVITAAFGVIGLYGLIRPRRNFT